MVNISKDRVKPSPYPTKWLLSDVFVHATCYGIYTAISTVTFFVIIVKTQFFQNRFGVNEIQYHLSNSSHPGWNDPILNSIIYLQTSIITQGLVFITRSRTFFFLDRPSFTLFFAFALAQIIATIIAVYGKWEFANVGGCGWSWAGIVWIWNIIWFFPFDLIKFALAAYFEPKKRLAIQENLQFVSSTPHQQRIRHNRVGNIENDSKLNLSRQSSMKDDERNETIEDSIVEATARYFSPYTDQLATSQNPTYRFAQVLANKNDGLRRVATDPDDLKRFSLIQAHYASRILRVSSKHLDNQTTPV